MCGELAIGKFGRGLATCLIWWEPLLTTNRFLFNMVVDMRCPSVTFGLGSEVRGLWMVLCRLKCFGANAWATRPLPDHFAQSMNALGWEDWLRFLRWRELLHCVGMCWRKHQGEETFVPPITIWICGWIWGYDLWGVEVWARWHVDCRSLGPSRSTKGLKEPWLSQDVIYRCSYFAPTHGYSCKGRFFWGNTWKYVEINASCRWGDRF